MDNSVTEAITPNQALVLSNGSKYPCVLFFEGKDMWNLWDDGTLRMHFEGLEPGLWYWTGSVLTIKHHFINGTEYDTELTTDGFRHLDNDEWEIWSQTPGDPPWELIKDMHLQHLKENQDDNKDSEERSVE